MGLLDDAIREHLELKRRRGASSSEVARQEQEAFGPPRRGDLEAEHDDSRHAALDEPAAFAEEPPRALQSVQDDPFDDDDPGEPEPVTRIHTPVEPPAAPSAQAQPPAEPVADSEPPAEPSARSLGDEGGQPTREFDAQELRAATEVPPRPAPEAERARPAAPPDDPPPPRPDAEEEEPEEDADVLEETPEFLQETPEHDRLWFEQRPPRDFDF